MCGLLQKDKTTENDVLLCNKQGRTIPGEIKNINTDEKSKNRNSEDKQWKRAEEEVRKSKKINKVNWKRLTKFLRNEKNENIKKGSFICIPPK